MAEGVSAALLARIGHIPRAYARPLHIAACLVMLSLSILFVSELVGFRDDGQTSASESRKTLAETVALHLSTLASIGDEGGIEYAVSSLVLRNADIRAASLTRRNGAVLAQYGEDNLLERFAPVSTLSHISVPILRDEQQWGELRVVFAPLRNLGRELIGLLFIIASSLMLFALFLGKAFIQLDPGRAVPGRVESALNLFSDGVVILDNQLRILMANRAALAIGDRVEKSLLGETLEAWGWEAGEDWQPPWSTTLHSGLTVSDQPLRLLQSDGTARLIMVSCALVGDDVEGARGVIVTLDDASSIERKNNELANMLKELRRSQELISEKNVELERLATTDAMTGISNRRVLMEKLEHALEQAQRESTPLACIMTDIDHFKDVNDTYGHGVGDEVIRAVASTLQSVCRETDTVGRYGGEEFVLVLPGLDAQCAAEVAERARAAVVTLAAGDRLVVPILSSSFGVADLSSGAKDAAGLVNAADQALYGAKQSGRNRVCLFAEEPVVSAVTESGTRQTIATKPAPQSEARLIFLQEQLAKRERELAVLREYDTLTGVPMRTLFLQRVDTELARAARSDHLVGVLSFELRDLERLISSFGHTASDALVVSVVDRLQESLRKTDLVSEISADYSLSRITSNEYGVLLAELSDAAGAMIVVTRLTRLLSQPFLVGKQKVYVGANIGIALSLNTEKGAADLFAQASDARVQAAAKPDKVSHAFAVAALDDESHDYIRLESDLHEALEAGQLEVHYQPKFDLKQRRVTGMEALLRWPHETRGFVSPAVFVAVAEANGLIERLSTYVTETVLQQILVWRSLGFDDLKVSVNVSPMQLRAESLVGSTLAALQHAGVEGRQLEIELTETSVLDRPEAAIVALGELRSAGVGISIDDFGTGYTSLGLLAELPINTIKIDRSFVAAMGTSSRRRAIVESLISMSHALGLQVVGEGIETNEQLETLTAFGCDLAQGYLISHALPADEATAFLTHQRNSETVRSA